MTDTNRTVSFDGLPAGVTISRTALVCSRQLTLAEWKSLGCTLEQHEDSIKWWLGDWWHYGAHRYGERKAMATAKNAFGRAYAFGTLMNYGYVAGRVETSRRREVLSFSHHVEVAKLKPDEQDRWLNVAVRDKLSVAKLRQKMLEDEFDGRELTNDEYYHHYYLHWLENAAQRSTPPCVLVPWANTELEGCLERCNPIAFASLAKAVEDAAKFWSKTAQFVRRIEESKSKNVRAKAPQLHVVATGREEPFYEKIKRVEYQARQRRVAQGGRS